MRIRARLLAGFICVALFTGLLGWYAVITIEQLKNGQQTVYGDVFGGTHLLAEWLDTSWEARADVLDYLLTEDPSAWTGLRAEMERLDARLRDLAVQMDAVDTDREDVATLNALMDAWDDYARWRDGSVVTALENGDRAAAVAAYRDEGVRLSNELDSRIDAFLAKKQEVGAALQHSAQASAEITRNIAFALSGGAVFLGLLTGLLLSRSIARGVGQVAAAAKGLAVGNVDQRIAIRSKDEIGEMANAFRDMIAYQQEMASVADAIARGDLTRNVQPKGPTDLLGTSFQRMIANLRALVDRLERSEEAQRFISQASRLLATSLDFEETLDSVARLAVPFLGDACLMDVHEEGLPRSLAKVALAGALPDGISRHLADLSTAVLRTGRPILENDVRFDAPLDSAAQASPAGASSASLMLVPLLVRGEPRGVMSFVSWPTRQYGSSDLAIAEELAHRCGLTMEKTRLYRAATDAIRVRDEFLSVASHEMKTPVTALLAFTQLELKRLQHRARPGGRHLRESLEEVRWQSERLARLVVQLLDTSRLDAGMLALALEPTDVAALVRAAVHVTQTNAPEHAVVLRSPDHLWALVDPVRLQQIVTNLLDNAVKFSPPDRAVEVDLEQPDRSSLRLTVRDHGFGVPPEHRAHIFDRFYQAHDERSAGVVGMGLGLYITRRMVELHGGTIDLECPTDGGTRFVAHLPVASSAQGGPGARTAISVKI